MQELEIRSVLVATDLLPTSDAVVASGYALAERSGAELHVLTALEVPTVPYPGLGNVVDHQREIHGARRALLDQVARAIPPGATLASHRVVVDSAPRAILQRATEVAADLIVIGPHRPRAFRGPILGNTADHILRSAKVPMLIVSEPLPLPLRKVVAPIDLSDPARGALDQALLWAGTLGARDVDNGLPSVDLRVIHVIPRIYETYDIPFDRAVIGPKLLGELEDARKRVGKSSHVDVVEEAIWGNAPSDEIVKYALTEKADLLVLGTHGYGAIGRALIGSVTSRVARAAPCAMLMVPPPLWAVPTLEENDVPAGVEAGS